MFKISPSDISNFASSVNSAVYEILLTVLPALVQEAYHTENAADSDAEKVSRIPAYRGYYRPPAYLLLRPASNEMA